MTQSRIITFCYLYLIGIVGAMLIPMPVGLAPLLWTLTVLLLAACAGVIGFVEHAAGLGRGEKRWRYTWLLVSLAALVFGYARYGSYNTIPDDRIASLVVLHGECALERPIELPDTSRITVRKTDPLSAPLRLRLHGELRARTPIESADGVPELDDKGRWRFREQVMPQTSEVVEIAPDAPDGATVIIAQPFNRIDRIEILDAPPDARFALYRVSNHIASFTRAGRNQTPVAILGRISQDPWVYNFKTVLTVTPEFIQYRPGGVFYRVAGGDVRATLQPAVPGYTDLARSDAYGYDVLLRGELAVAPTTANPGGFDQRQYLVKHGVFGQMNLSSFPDAPPPIVAVPAGDRGLRRGNALVEFSLALRDDMLRTIKATVPYPVSSFLGAISLGLRYGLQNTECVFSDQHQFGGIEWFQSESPCRERIAEEFKRSGVNHVLAVSGLHVTIIMIMFMGIFTLLRVSRKVFVPVIVLALVIFAIITGARPSTMRAVIMNSLFLLTWGYLEKDLRSSILLGVPVAAFIILLQNPEMVVDPSFTLSFGAILSLALLTGPCQNVLNRFRGNDFIVLLLLLALLTMAVIVRWPLVTSIWFWIPFAGLAALLFWFGRFLASRGVAPIGERGFEDLPVAVGALIAAQGAIQLGMMIPLSAFYFGQWPVAGAYANLLAIPLVGIVLQLAMMAGMIGLIPGIGLAIAFWLNAANWIFSLGFLLIAHYFSEWFPYPFVPRPNVIMIVLYYALCALFVWWHPLLKRIARGRAERAATARRQAIGIAALTVLLLIVSGYFAWGRPFRSGLDLTVLSVRYGSSILVETPGGKTLLIDAAHVETDRARFNAATRDILPFLAKRGIRHFDGVFLTSAALERSAGIAHILANSRVDALYTSPALAALNPNMSFDDFLEALGLEVERPEYDLSRLAKMYDQLVHPAAAQAGVLSLTRILAQRDTSWLDRWARNDTRSRPLHAGNVLFRETDSDGREFRIEVLSPPADSTACPIDDGSLVLRLVYGDTAILLPSDIRFDTQQALAGCPGLDMRADVLFFPNRGTALPGSDTRSFMDDLRRALSQTTAPFLEAVSPSTVIFEFGNPRPVLGADSRAAIRAHEIARRFVEDRFPDARVLSTDRDLAIRIHSDGLTVNVSTLAEELRDPESGAPDSVSDLEIGL